jgi:EcsC protein family
VRALSPAIGVFDLCHGTEVTSRLCRDTDVGPPKLSSLMSWVRRRELLASGYNRDMASQFGSSAREARDSATRWFAERAATIDANALGDALLVGIDKASESRWEAAVERAAQLPGSVRPQKVKALTDMFARELATVGAATGAVAAAPAVGTGASLFAAVAELGWFTARTGDLILTMAALHGREAPTLDERRAWVLAVLIFGSSAREGFTSAAKQVGLELEQSNTRVPLATLRAMNGVLGNRLLRRYGTRRGAVALGTALPLGIGAVVGGTANYSAVKLLARNADRFFAKLPYSTIETTATEST